MIKPTLVHKNGQFHGQTHVPNPTYPPNWQFRGQTYDQTRTRPPNWQFRGQTHVQTNTRPQKRAISRTDPRSSPHSSTKTGNFTDRPMFQIQLVHQIGNSVDRPTVKAKPKIRRGGILERRRGMSVSRSGSGTSRRWRSSLRCRS